MSLYMYVLCRAVPCLAVFLHVLHALACVCIYLIEYIYLIVTYNVMQMDDGWMCRLYFSA
jgi:hypothetical protein